MGNNLISEKVFSTVFPKGKKVVIPLLNKLLKENNIDTLSRVSSFLSQCGHESANFTTFEENLNYSATGLLKTFGKYFSYSTAVLYERQPYKIASRVYANRMGNGPEESGDGWKYRGRGLIQLTGKNNYQAFANYKGISLDDCVGYLETLQGKIESSIWYWNTRNLNKFSDMEDIKGLTKAINGGYYGLSHREKLFVELKRILTNFLGKGEDFNIHSVHSGPRIKVSKSFYRDDFECDVEKCGCGYDFVDFKIVNIMQIISDSVNNRKIKIYSGTRCEFYNKVVGIPNSLHRIGQAIDFEIPEDKENKLPAIKSNDIINLINKLFNKKIYCYDIDEFKVHLDIRSNKNPESIKVLRNITRADLMIDNKIDSLDIAIYLILKSFLKVINRDLKIISVNMYKKGKLSKNITFQILENKIKNLPKMKSIEIKRILKQVFGNLLILQEIDEYTIFMDVSNL
jgi:putative chitinase